METVQYNQTAARRLADHPGGWCYLRSQCWSQGLCCWQIGHSNSSCSWTDLRESKSITLSLCIICLFVSPSADDDFNNQWIGWLIFWAVTGVARERGWLVSRGYLHVFCPFRQLWSYTSSQNLSPISHSYSFQIPDHPVKPLAIIHEHWSSQFYGSLCKFDISGSEAQIVKMVVWVHRERIIMKAGEMCPLWKHTYFKWMVLRFVTSFYSLNYKGILPY